MGEVVNLDVPTTLDIQPKAVLAGASEADLVSVMVLGWDKEGGLYIASSLGDIGDLLVLLEAGKRETVARIEV